MVYCSDVLEVIQCAPLPQSSSTSLQASGIIRLVLSITAFSITRSLTKGRERERRRGRGRLGERRKQAAKPLSKNQSIYIQFLGNARACCSNADPINRPL